MSIIGEIEEINVTVEPTPEIVLLKSAPDVIIVGSASLGPQGPVGPPGQWTALTQAEYDALNPPDPEMLYLIIS